MINCQVCEHNPTGERCELFGRVIGMHGCSSGVERKPRNNFERLKTLNIGQMADFLHDFAMCENTSLAWIEEWLKEAIE